MSKALRIRDLPKDGNMRGVRFVYPLDGKSYFWYSQWQGTQSGGVFGKIKLSDSRTYPLHVKSLEECLDWVVVPSEPELFVGDSDHEKDDRIL